MDYKSLLPKFLSDLDPNILLSDNYIVLDLETTNLDGSPTPTNPDNDIVCAAWVDGKGRVRLVYGSIYEQYDLIQACYNADIIVGHNIKFDLGYLKRAGLDLRKVMVYDTMIGEYVLTGNSLAGKKDALSLDALSKKYVGKGKSPFIDICMKGKGNPAEMIQSFLERRCRSDILQTREVFLKQRQELVKQRKLAVQYTSCLLSPALCDIEMYGVYLDSAAVDTEYRNVLERFTKVSAELAVFMSGVNPNSVPQKREFIYNVLKFKPPKKGRTVIYPTGVDDMRSMLNPTNNRQRKFLELIEEYGQCHALLSKNLEYFKGVCEHRGCEFFAEFNQAVTATHRLSSSGIGLKLGDWKKSKSVQFQNFPRKYKCLFKARSLGWYMVEADGAQIEFRVAGFVAQDVRICQDIVDGVDIHRFTASVLAHISEADVSDELRTNSKRETFKPVYGGQFGDGKGFKKADQEAYYAAFREKYAGLASTQKKWEATALRTKRVRTCTGLEFFFPGCKVTGSGYNPSFPSICNYPVQNLATGEIVPVSIVAIWHLIGALDMQAKLSNTIHDSVVGEVPGEELQQYYDICKWAFLWWVYEYLDRVYDLQFNVPLGVGIKAGINWGVGMPGLISPEVCEGETAKVKGGEITVTGIPHVRMEGVDYSSLEKTHAKD